MGSIRAGYIEAHPAKRAATPMSGDGAAACPAAGAIWREPWHKPHMEMHQVRYFLAMARSLNFTRAAEECNVTQPSLTRAVKLLEAELGGDLFRRERPRAILTPLGERMYPPLKQCYDSAQSARSLAAMIKDGEVGVLKLAVSSSIELGLILNEVNELRKCM